MRTIIAIVFCFLLFAAKSPAAQEMDKELSTLADKLAVIIKDQGKKKVTVLDFTDLQGNGSELGKYIAEELTVNLVMVKKNFSVLDRANLRKILAEHKLTATGLVDPENAKKLGMFAGVDALILGTMVTKGRAVGVSAKIITVDTAEIVGAVKGEFTSDEDVQKLVAQPATAGPATEKAQVVKSFGDLDVELNELSIANGRNYRLDFVLKNKNKAKSIWVGLGTEENGTTRVRLTDPDRVDFQSQMELVSGIECAPVYYDGTIYKATEIGPGDSLSGSIQFFSRSGRTATAGQCSVQLEFVSSPSMNPTAGGRARKHNVGVKMEAK